GTHRRRAAHCAPAGSARQRNGLHARDGAGAAGGGELWRTNAGGGRSEGPLDHGSPDAPQDPAVTRLSATIIAQDEERDLPDCIRSLRGFCDEILVVDGGSRDRTREIAASLGARVLERTFDDFARQHEFARVEARGEWVLSIDAD